MIQGEEHLQMILNFQLDHSRGVRIELLCSGVIDDGDVSFGMFEGISGRAKSSLHARKELPAARGGFSEDRIVQLGSRTSTRIAERLKSDELLSKLKQRGEGPAQ